MVAHPADGDSRLCWRSALQYRTVQLHIAQYLVCIFIRYSGQTAAPHVTRSPHNPFAVPPSAPPSPLLHTTTLPTVNLPTTYLLHLPKLYLAFERENPLFSSLGVCIFRTVTLHQRPLRTIYDTLSLTKSTLLTADTILWSTINPVPNWWFSFPLP